MPLLLLTAWPGGLPPKDPYTSPPPSGLCSTQKNELEELGAQPRAQFPQLLLEIVTV